MTMQVTREQANELLMNLQRTPSEQRDEFENEFLQDHISLTQQFDSFTTQIEDLREKTEVLKKTREQVDGKREYVKEKLIVHSLKKQQKATEATEAGVEPGEGEGVKADAEPKSEANTPDRGDGRDSVEPVVAPEQERTTAETRDSAPPSTPATATRGKDRSSSKRSANGKRRKGAAA